jgi:pimeloyl-ACP methyl ester carboxylesterase
VADAAAGRAGLVIVGQSYGAFTATLAASLLPARLLVLLAGMIPVPGESPGQWWESFILCQDDHFFPAAFMRQLARERLGTVPDEVPGGHCAALSHPGELSELLVSYLA